MKIIIADNTQSEKWDSYINKNNDALPYSLFAWKKVVESAYGHNGYYLLAKDGEKTVGAMPLIHIKIPLCKGKLVGLPFCDAGGVLGDSDNVVSSLFNEAVSLAKTLNISDIDIRSTAPNLAIESGNIPFRIFSGKVRMVMDIFKTSDQLLKEFKAKLRSQINKAEKNGLIFVIGGSELIESFYSVFSENMRDLGSPVHSKGLFKSLFNCYGEKARLGMVYLKDKAVGGGLILCSGSTVCIPWASTLRKYNKLAPNMILYWNLVKYSADRGFAKFDFGRSTPGEGTYTFKSQWGAEPKPLYWYIVNLDSKCQKNDIDTSESRARERIESIWKMMPLGVANFIGPIIRRHISL